MIKSKYETALALIDKDLLNLLQGNNHIDTSGKLHRFWWEAPGCRSYSYKCFTYQDRLNQLPEITNIVRITDSISPSSIQRIVKDIVELLRSTIGYFPSPINGQLYEESQLTHCLTVMLNDHLAEILQMRRKLVEEAAYSRFQVRRKRGQDDDAMADWAAAEAIVDAQIKESLNPTKTYPRMDTEIQEAIQYIPGVGVMYHASLESYERQLKRISPSE